MRLLSELSCLTTLHAAPSQPSRVRSMLAVATAANWLQQALRTRHARQHEQGVKQGAAMTNSSRSGRTAKP